MTTQNLWITYAEEVKRFIYSKVKNKAVTDDLLQDVFIKVHTKSHTLKNNAKIKPWIFSIARNAVFDHFKSGDISFEFAYFESETWSHESEHTEKDCLRGILEKLPKKYKAPLFLSDIQGLKQKEVAAQLQQSLSTTKSQIQRGRKLIAQGFMECCGYVLNSDGKLVGELQDKETCKVCN